MPHTADDIRAPLATDRAHTAHPSHSSHPAHPAHPVRPAHPAHPAHGEPGESLNRIALVATLHCLSGCAIGEVAGLLIGSALGWGNGATIALAVALAFVSGFALTAWPFLRRGYPPRDALRIAMAADAASIAVMELVDNALMMAIPGAMDASLTSGLFWGAMLASLAVAGVAAYPVNRWLIARGLGHAVAHPHH